MPNERKFELSGLAQPILKKSHNRLGDSVIHVILKNGITPSHPIQCSYWENLSRGNAIFDTSSKLMFIKFYLTVSFR